MEILILLRKTDADRRQGLEHSYMLKGAKADETRHMAPGYRLESDGSDILVLRVGVDSHSLHSRIFRLSPLSAGHTAHAVSDPFRVQGRAGRTKRASAAILDRAPGDKRMECPICNGTGVDSHPLYPEFWQWMKANRWPGPVAQSKWWMDRGYPGDPDKWPPEQFECLICAGTGEL